MSRTPKAGITTLRKPTLLLSASLLSACSNSPLFINPIYNRLDEQIMTSFERLTDFDEKQTAHFNQITENFHYWHRTSELPAYAGLLHAIQKSIRSKTPTTRAQVAFWMRESESFTQSFRACHPINFSNDIIRSLSDSQLAQIRKNRLERQAEYRERYFDETPEARLERRAGNILKWISRAGLQLDDKQKEMLRDTLSRQISLRRQYFELSAEWNERLYEILDERHSPELDARMAAHLDELWHLLERAHPQQWRQNRELWTDFILQLIHSLSSEQRSYSSGWIKKMGKTLLTVSRRVEQKPVFSAHIGCALPAPLSHR